MSAQRDDDSIDRDVIDAIVNYFQGSDISSAEVWEQGSDESARTESSELLRVVSRLKQVSTTVPTDPYSDVTQSEGLLPSIIGDFRLLRKIGHGGMGVVYEAEQISLRRRVAVKLLPFVATLDGDKLKRFRRESRVVAHLSHDNVVPVHCVGACGQLHYFAMELIGGPNLSQFIAAKKSSDPKAEAWLHALAGQGTGLGAVLRAPITSSEYQRFVATIGIQIARALHFAHDQGVYHCDIKPGNILIDTEVKPWITDFGVAECLTADVSLTHVSVNGCGGTLRYMDPHRLFAENSQPDRRSDVYSLGVTLYELLTLQAAYPLSRQDRPPRLEDFENTLPVRRLNGQVPKELSTIIRTAMSPYRDERYTNAKELADDLQRFLDNEAIQGAGTNRVGMMIRRLKRYPVALFSAAAVVLCIAASFVIYASGNGKEAEVVNSKREAEISKLEKLVQEAEAIRLAQPPGYRAQVGRLLTEAQRRLTDDHDRQKLRRLATLCMGNFNSLDPALVHLDARVTALAMDPAESILVVGLADGSARVYAAQDFRAVSHLASDDVPVVAVHCISGKELLVVKSDGNVIEWAWGSDEKYQTVRRYTTAAESSDRQTIAQSRFAPRSRQLYLLPEQGDSVVVLALQDQSRTELSLPSRVETLSCIAISPNEDALVAGFANTATSGGVLKWDLRQPDTPLELTGGAVRDLAFSSDGSVLLAALVWNGLWVVDAVSFQSRVVRTDVNVTGVFEAAEDQMILTEGAGPLLFDVFSTGNMFLNRRICRLQSQRPFIMDPLLDPVVTRSSRNLVAAANDRVVAAWNLQALTEITHLPGHARVVTAAAFHPRQRQLASAGADHLIRIWDLEDRPVVVAKQAIEGEVNTLAFNADGSLLVAGDNQGTVRLWESGTLLPVGQRVCFPNGKVSDCRFSPDGNHLAVAGSGGVVVLQLDDPRDGIVSMQQSSLWTDHSLQHVCFDFDGQFVACSGNSGVVLIDAMGDQPAERADEHIQSVVDSCEAGWLCLNQKGNVELWQGQAASSVATTVTSQPWRTIISPDRRYLATPTAAGIDVWDLSKQQLAATLPIVDQKFLSAISWSGDSKMLAVGTFDGAVVIWHLDQVAEHLKQLGL